MTIYNASLDDLPETALVVDRRQDLMEIEDPAYNVVMWRRGRDSEMLTFAANLSAIKEFGRETLPGFEVYVEKLEMVWASRISRSKRRRFRRGRAAFLEEHRQLRSIMEQLQAGRNSSTFSVTDCDVRGYNFHQDCGYSLNWTLVGPPGLWVENRFTERINERSYRIVSGCSEIRQYPNNVVALYKGADLSSLFPFIHSRPGRVQGVRRAHTQIYL